MQLLRIHSVLEDDIKFLILWCCNFRHLSPDLALEHGKWLMCFCYWQRSVTLGGSTVHLYLYGPCCGVAHKLQHRPWLQLGHRPRHDLRQQLGLINILAPSVSLAIQIRMVLLADQRGHRFTIQTPGFMWLFMANLEPLKNFHQFLRISYNVIENIHCPLMGHPNSVFLQGVVGLV